MDTMTPAPSAAALRVGAVIIDIDGDHARDVALEFTRRARIEIHADNGDRELTDMLLEDATTIGDMAYPEGSLDALALKGRLVAAAEEYERRWPPSGVTP